MEEEFDFLDLIYYFWKKKFLILFFVIIGVICGNLYTRFLVVPEYTSSTTLILAKSNNGSSYTSQDAITQSDITLNQKLISTYGELLKSRRVANTVINNLKLDMDYKEIKKCVSVSSVKDTDLIKVSITTDDAKLSQKIATEMVKVFTDEVDRVYNINNVSIIDEAEVENNAVNVNYFKSMVVFGAVALVITCGVIFLIYYFDNTIKNEETITKLTDYPVLAQIPKVNTKKGGKKNDR